MRKNLKLLFFSVCLCSKLPSVANAQTMDYSLQANIIYHLTKYMEWPNHKTQPDFIIGVIGETNLFEELQNATLNKLAGNKKIIIRNYSCSQDNYNCQMLFISEDESRCLKAVAGITAAKPVLIITEKEGFAIKGSCINFNISDGRLQLEINKDNIEQRNLKIASELLSLGVVVNNKNEINNKSKK